MSKDILMIPDQSGDVSFSVVGEQADTGLALLQRLYVIILSDNSEAYRGGTGFSLLQFAEGANTPPDSVLNSMLAIACANARNQLDAEDARHVLSFSGTALNSNITFVLELTDGTTVKGILTNA